MENILARLGYSIRSRSFSRCGNLRRRVGTRSKERATKKQVDFITDLVRDYNQVKGGQGRVTVNSVLGCLALGEMEDLGKGDAAWIIQNLLLRIELYKNFSGLATREWRESRPSSVSPWVAASELADSILCPCRWKIRREMKDLKPSFQAEMGLLLHHPGMLRNLLTKLAFRPWEQRKWLKLLSRERTGVSPGSRGWRHARTHARSRLIYEDAPGAAVIYGKSLPICGKPDLVLADVGGLTIVEEKFRMVKLPTVALPSDRLQVMAYMFLIRENGAFFKDQRVKGLLRYCLIKGGRHQRREFQLPWDATYMSKLQGVLASLRQAKGGVAVSPRFCKNCPCREKCAQGGV